MAEYDLIKIREFVHKGNPTGKEEIPIADASGTYKTPADTLIAMVATAKGFIKASALVPLNNAISTKLDKSSVIDSLTSTSTIKPVSARQAKILNDKIASFASQIGTGIIGEAKPATVPIANGFGIYTVSTPGVYINFLDTNGDPIEVLESDLANALVQLWGNDGVWEKQITQVNSSAPESSETGFVQV